MKREQILIEALPYIREFYGSFIVIKIGGHAMVDKRLIENIIEDIVLLRYVGMQPVPGPWWGSRNKRKDGKDGKETKIRQRIEDNR